MRGDSYLISFLTEADDKKYTKDLTKIMKPYKVSKIEDMIT